MTFRPFGVRRNAAVPQQLLAVGHSRVPAAPFYGDPDEDVCVMPSSVWALVPFAGEAK